MTVSGHYNEPIAAILRERLLHRAAFQDGDENAGHTKPGHETNPIFLDENVRKIMVNAVKWAAPAK